MDSTSVTMFDSWKVTVSPTLKTSLVKYTNSKLFAEGDETTLAIALPEFPTTFSPIIAFVWTLAVEVNWNLSKVGFPVPKDS